ncbi:MAG: hypothetical protein VYA53_01500 [Acidobacteriota bacterium]|nr:hypothetical protein [Acidobacteriota bacterium]
MLYRFLVIVVSCVGLCSPLWGQRVSATIDLKVLDANLTFDTNNIHLPNSVGIPTNDLNFSPNVVFSFDSSKAFVSIPGSNKILVVDPANGTPLNPQPLLEVGANPALMSLTPDGSKICVVSLLLDDNIPTAGDVFKGKEIGSIAIIDIDTLKIQTLNLTKVFFSVGNNIVFSKNGKTGYIASSGTDQIIRFDVESATEITPRLDLTNGTRPSSITMAPDHSFFTVVLVGSTALPQLETPDSILIIDPDSFTVTKTIVPTVKGEIVLPHNFAVSNTLAISSDGQFGLIGDREVSHITSSSELDDHALFLDLQTGEVLATIDIGGISRGAFTTPDGENFVILSDREIALVNISSRQTTRIIPPFTGFKDSTRPAFSHDLPRMFIASAVRDLVMEFDLKSEQFTRYVDVGPSLIVDDNGIEIAIPAGPLDISLSPNGAFLTAVKFNANTIAVMKNSARLFFPKVVSNKNFFTSITATNTSSKDTTITFQMRDTSGRPSLDDPQTDEVPDFKQPKNADLKSGHQISFTARGLVEATEGSNLVGWLDLASDQHGLAGFALIGDSQIQSLDGTPGITVTSNEWILPEVRVNKGFRTSITIVNPTAETASSVGIALINSNGSTVEEVSRSIASNGVFTAFLRQADPGDDSIPAIFSETSFANFGSGYIKISSEGQRVIAFEHYFDNKRISVLNGIPVGGEVQLPTRLYLPQFSVFGGSETFLNLVHSGTSNARVSLSIKNDQGENLASRSTLVLAPSESIRINLVDLFGLIDRGKAITGWLLLESDTSGVIGDGEIHTFSGRAMTTIALDNSASRDFIFPYVTQGADISTGITLLNPESQPANILMEISTAQGTLLDTTSLMVGGSERVIGLLDTFFSVLPDLPGGYIKVSSDQALIGLEIFFANNLDFITAVLTKPLN